MLYECPISLGSKANVKYFQKQVKSQGQGHEFNIFDTNSMILSQKIHMCNM